MNKQEPDCGLGDPMLMMLVEYCMAKGTDFEILEKIGDGGMGEVYKARLFNDFGFEKIIAAKKIHASGSDRTIMREAQILSKLSHPNICSVFDLKEHDGNVYMLMEFIDGQSLSEVQGLALQKGYRFSDQFLGLLAFEVLKGLECAHSSNDQKVPVIHRDISPQNVMISLSGEVKILDFGVARLEKTAADNTQKACYGKLRYCAPEILRGAEYDQGADLYALGILLFELCTGVKVFEGLTESQIIAQKMNHDLDYSIIAKCGRSAEFKNFIEKLTSSEVNKRFKSAKEAIEYLTTKSLLGTTDVAREVISAEVAQLKNSGIERTKTVQVPIVAKPSAQMRSFALAGVFLTILVAIGIFYKIKSPNKAVQIKPMEIKVISEGTLTTLSLPPDDGRVAVGGELGFTMFEFNCLSAMNSILSFPSLTIDPEIERKLKFYNMLRSPKEFLIIAINDYSNKETSLSLLKKSCLYQGAFKSGVTFYEDINEVMKKKKDVQFQSFKDLVETISKSTIFTNQKYNDLYKAENELIVAKDREKLDAQIKGIREFHITNFKVLSVPEDIFPETLSECRTLADMYWANEAIKLPPRKEFIQDFRVVIVPFPIDGEIMKTGPSYIEFSDNQKATDSIFRKKGVCSFQRVNGEVVESSLRKL